MPRSPSSSASSREGKAKGLFLLLGVAGIVLAVGLWWWSPGGTEPAGPEGLSTDPRLAYSGPFRNVHPEVKYVGDAACARCHLDISRTYDKHPMGRSLTPIAPLAPRQPYGPETHNPFRRDGWLFTVEVDGQKVWHRTGLLDPEGEVVEEFRLPVDYAIGSGTRGHSYLSVRDGFVTQTPISWYAGKDVWDLSPGFSESYFRGRPVEAECLYCHANRAHAVEGTFNRYREPVFTGHAIGCERCHGPGELHEARQKKMEPYGGEFDDTIVNPRHLDWQLRQAVCEQCHLKGERRVVRRGRGRNDFRPGLPLQAFWGVLIRASGAEETSTAVTHVEQMYSSVCFQKSPEDRKLTCVSCHDPHVPVRGAERVPYYKARCLTCHGQHGCSLAEAERLRRQPQDSCIACHMPARKTSDIPHTATTDHRILRAPPPEVPYSEELAQWPPLAHFYRDREGFDEAEGRRDMGVGLMKLAGVGKLPAGRTSVLALEMLEEAVRRAPDDVPALEAQGIALANLGRDREAMEAFERVLQKEPGWETTLEKAAFLSQQRGRLPAALGYWRRVAEVNPTRADARRHLARLLLRQGEWEGLRPHVRAWVDLEPQDTEARLLWVRCLLREGKEAEARAEFAKVRRLRPGFVPGFEEWLAKEGP